MEQDSAKNNEPQFKGSTTKGRRNPLSRGTRVHVPEDNNGNMHHTCAEGPRRPSMRKPRNNRQNKPLAYLVLQGLRSPRCLGPSRKAGELMVPLFTCSTARHAPHAVSHLLSNPNQHPGITRSRSPCRKHTPPGGHTTYLKRYLQSLKKCLKIPQTTYSNLSPSRTHPQTLPDPSTPLPQYPSRASLTPQGPPSEPLRPLLL